MVQVTFYTCERTISTVDRIAESYIDHVHNTRHGAFASRDIQSRPFLRPIRHILPRPLPPCSITSRPGDPKSQPPCLHLCISTKPARPHLHFALPTNSWSRDLFAFKRQLDHRQITAICSQRVPRHGNQRAARPRPTFRSLRRRRSSSLHGLERQVRSFRSAQSMGSNCSAYIARNCGAHGAFDETDSDGGQG